MRTDSKVWLFIFAFAVVVPSAFTVASCGRFGDGGPMKGVVTAKIAPKGSVDCTPMATSCGSDDTWKLIIEPLAGHKDTGGGWYEQVSTICIGPRAWRSFHQGDVYIRARDGGDLHCDG